MARKYGASASASARGGGMAKRKLRKGASKRRSGKTPGKGGRTAAR